MKQIYRHSNATFLFFLSALLLCLGSCQSSDNTEVGEGATVASLPLKVQIGDDTSSRVGMTDGSTFSCYWNLDKLNIYHKYVLSGAVQSMTPLEFSTTTTSGLTATFSYTGGAYRYNPGTLLYAFSSNTSGSYTAGVAADGTSTLTVSALAGQSGTLTDCAKYDALYGSATVNFDTGLPESLTMNHLFGMLNLHLTNSNFSTNYPVTVALTSSDSNILPGNNGTAILNAAGSILTPSGSGRWSTSWSATVTPTTNGVVDVYFMTWPFSSINGTFTVSCSDGSGSAYTPRTVTLSGFSLKAAQLKFEPLAITSASTFDSSKLYAWDATDLQPVTRGVTATNANTTATANNYTDMSNHASYACKNCPNGYEITWYLSVPCYWDSGSISGGNTTIYTCADGSTTTAGMWFRKSSGITGFSDNTSSNITNGTVTALTADLATSLNLTTDYFFLPAAGSTTASAAYFLSGGSEAYYWSSSPCTGTDNACNLHFSNTSATSSSNPRSCGFNLWQKQ